MRARSSHNSTDRHLNLLPTSARTTEILIRTRTDSEKIDILGYLIWAFWMFWMCRNNVTPPISYTGTIIFWLNSVRSQISPAVLFYGLFVLKLIQSRWETGKWLWYVIEILISRFHAEEIKSQWDTIRVPILLNYFCTQKWNHTCNTPVPHRYSVGYII